MITWPQSITEARWPIPSGGCPSLARRPLYSLPGSTRLAYGELWIDGREQEVALARLIVGPSTGDKRFVVYWCGYC